MSSETSLPCWFKTSQSLRSDPILERQCHSEKLSFVHKKETGHSFELFLSICVFYRRSFNLQMQRYISEDDLVISKMIPSFSVSKPLSSVFPVQTYVGRTFCFPSLTGTKPVCFIGDTVRARPVKL